MKARCPTCKQPLPGPGCAGHCAKCKGPILRGDKWHFNNQGRREHRHCDAPQSYSGTPKGDSEIRRMRKRAHQ
jgi:hypothetical protein